MPITGPVSDSNRAINHEPDHTWPSEVKVQLIWMIDGHPYIRTHLIDGDMFFGNGQYGAPMEGAALINHIERMRREGPPPRVKARRDYKSRDKNVRKSRR